MLTSSFSLSTTSRPCQNMSPKRDMSSGRERGSCFVFLQEKQHQQRNHGCGKSNSPQGDRLHLSVPTIPQSPTPSATPCPRSDHNREEEPVVKDPNNQIQSDIRTSTPLPVP
jgi:hypothetical protein